MSHIPHCDGEGELLATDRRLRAEADELLETRGLRRLLQEYSPIQIVGSYALELMVWRDLDVLMDAPQITIDEFFDLGRRITALLSPWKMFFTDNQNYEGTPYPRGLYWGIRLGDIKKGSWKVDLWAFDSEQSNEKARECQHLKARLNLQNRLTILRLKSQLWRDPRYRNEVTSQDLYEAVLDHEVHSLTEFWNHVRNKQEESASNRPSERRHFKSL